MPASRSTRAATTSDLNATFPAEAARELGLSQAPLLCGQEIDVPGSLPMCLRVLILFNTGKAAKEIVHVYLKDARKLRPDNDRKQRKVKR
jgi:chorismate mutase